jgi:dTMP kinase
MFITLEGPEGSGKTTQIPELAEFLHQAGYDVLTTREPGGTPISDQIRAILLDNENTAMHPRTEILLFQASRAQHVEQVIHPHLQKGGIVLCDRYAESTLAYQGYGYGLDIEDLRKIIEFATGGLKPDLVLLLDVEPETGLLRRNQGGDVNRLDAYDLAFHRRVREGYHQLAKADPNRWVTVDANRSPDVVQREIRRAVTTYLEAVKTAPPR